MAKASDEALRFEDVSVTFRDARGAIYAAVSDTTLHVEAGEFLSVVGPTGCGKSTLLNLAAGLLAPTSGQVRVFGTPLDGINRRAGYLFQGDSLMPWRSARDNVAAGPEFAGASRATARVRAEAWLNRVGLYGHGLKYPHQMSGGMRKRAQLAQVLVLDPPILLMDEPFAALDVQTRLLMENELLALWQADRKSVLFITHDLEEAISLSDRVVVLSAGPATRSVVAGISPSGATTPTHLTSFDADGDRASQLQHAVQGEDGDGNFGGTTLIFATAQAITDHLLVASDSSLNPAAGVVA